jgi:hypothetical protein
MLRHAHFYMKGALRSFAAPSTKVTNAGPSCHSLRLRQCLLSRGAMQKADYAADTATL